MSVIGACILFQELTGNCSLVPLPSSDKLLSSRLERTDSINHENHLLRGCREMPKGGQKAQQLARLKQTFSNSPLPSTPVSRWLCAMKGKQPSAWIFCIPCASGTFSSVVPITLSALGARGKAACPNRTGTEDQDFTSCLSGATRVISEFLLGRGHRSYMWGLLVPPFTEPPPPSSQQ